MVEYAREAVRIALAEQFGDAGHLRWAVVAKTEDGVVITDEGGQAYEVAVRAL